MWKETDVLLVIDVQNDFCPGGKLAVPGGDEVVPLINRLARGFKHVRKLGFDTEVIEAACRSIDLDGSADAARRSFAEHGIVLA